MGSHDRLLELIQELYGVPGTQHGWTRFLDSLCDAVNGSCAHFISVNQRDCADVALTVRTDPDALVAYREHWHGFDPWGRSDRLRTAPSGTVVLADEMISENHLRRTAYWTDFGRQYDLVRCVVGMIEAAPE